MEAVVVNFRGSRRTRKGNHAVLLVNGFDSKEKAAELVGKGVVWVSPGKQKKELKGAITSTHGSRGAVRARFERGLPGQIIGKKVLIVGH